MQLTENERAALVAELAKWMRTAPLNRQLTYEDIAEEFIDRHIDRLLATRTAPTAIDTGYELTSGERILEGDVLECECEGLQLVKWEPLMSTWIVWSMGEFDYCDDDGNEQTFPFDQIAELKEYISWHGKMYTFNRIGNVYDNPDLIGRLDQPTIAAAGIAPEPRLDELLDGLPDGWRLEHFPYYRMDDGDYHCKITVPFKSRAIHGAHSPYYGTGPTRMDAIRNAVAQATGTTQEGTSDE